MAIMRDLIKRNRSEGGMDAKNRWWVSELLAKDCEKHGSTQDGSYQDTVEGRLPGRSTEEKGREEEE